MIDGRNFYIRVRVDEDEGWELDGVLDSQDEFWNSDEDLGSSAVDSMDGDAIMEFEESGNLNVNLGLRDNFKNAPTCNDSDSHLKMAHISLEMVSGKREDLARNMSNTQFNKEVMGHKLLKVVIPTGENLYQDDFNNYVMG